MFPSYYNMESLSPLTWVSDGTPDIDLLCGLQMERQWQRGKFSEYV